MVGIRLGNPGNTGFMPQKNEPRILGFWTPGFWEVLPSWKFFPGYFSQSKIISWILFPSWNLFPGYFSQSKFISWIFFQILVPRKKIILGPGSWTPEIFFSWAQEIHNSGHISYYSYFGKDSGLPSRESGE